MREDFAEQVHAYQQKLASELRTRFDYIICGAGTPGSVVAARLAADPATRVLLLEAGGADETDLVPIPNNWPKTLATDLVLGFQAEPNPKRNGFEEGLLGDSSSKPATAGVGNSQRVLLHRVRSRCIGSKVAASSTICWWKRPAPWCGLIPAFARNIAILALALSASFSNANAQRILTADQTQIVDTVKTVFAAAQADDITLLNTVVARDFYLYDGGTRFNEDGMMTFIKTQYAAGKRFEWNVTEPDVHVSGNTAWLAYVNKGSITDASGTTNQKWLESAFLEKQAGVWKIVFMHSTRVPAAVEGNHGK